MYEKISDRIKIIRTKKKMSQEAFGKVLGVTKSSVSLLESGKNNPSEQTKLLICEKLGVNKDWLENGGPDEDMFKPEFETDDLVEYFAELSINRDPFIVEMLKKYRKLSPEHKRVLWEIYQELTEAENNNKKGD